MSQEVPDAKRPRRSKAVGDSEKLDADDERDLFLTLWRHWQAYLLSTEDQEDLESTPDIDELMEMLEIGRTYRNRIVVPSPPKSSATKQPDDDVDALVDFYVQAWKQPWDLIPVLLSIAAHILADDAIALYLEQKSTNQKDSDKQSPLDTSAPCGFLEQALTWFPANASTWSMLANWVRMTPPSLIYPQQESQVLEIAKLYRHAAYQASILRRASLEILAQYNDRNDKEQEEDIQEELPPLPSIIETLLLNQVVGVEYVGPDEEEEEEDEQEDGDGYNGERENTNEEEIWSVSAVEGTSRFMAAMQLSIAGYHDDAAVELAHFDVSHRLHPNVWDKTKAVRGEQKSSPILEEPILEEPVLFDKPVLPIDVHEKMLQIFAPDAPFWVDSGYSQRGYYSFFIDRLAEDQKPKDFVQDVVEAYLLPLVEKNLSSDAIVGYEWWVHTRPLQANLGHNLHFDTDETLLKQEQEVTHPLISSVLYLDGTKNPGPTIVLNQSSDASARNADMIWRNDPTPNSFLLFPGKFLHGVLPCGTSAPVDDNEKKFFTELGVESELDFKKYISKGTNSTLPADESHRLSFMVGFWTRRVPDKMKDPTRLYGPCGPIPPSTHSWVKQVQKSYPRTRFHSSINAPQPISVPRVCPAWQSLPAKEHPRHEPLDIPKALDHRFFVRDPPKCFRDSLFERQEEESDDEKEKEAGATGVIGK